jgi:hypothetical protein
MDGFMSEIISKWRFGYIEWDWHRKWWKPYVHKFKIENEMMNGELRWKTLEEQIKTRKAWLDYYGHDAFWSFNWLGFEITFLRD